MRRVGILSDSHGNWDMAEQAVRAMGDCDELAHAGDYYRDALHLEDCLGVPVRAVTGNCDRSVTGPQEEVWQVDGHRIFLTHGHLYGVKYGLLKLYYRARELDAEIVIFGHTHVPLDEIYEGIYFINPGSVSWSRGQALNSYAVLEFEKGQYNGQIFYLPD
jgi:putative phosphoesterase